MTHKKPSNSLGVGRHLVILRTMTHNGISHISAPITNRRLELIRELAGLISWSSVKRASQNSPYKSFKWVFPEKHIFLSFPQFMSKVLRKSKMCSYQNDFVLSEHHVSKLQLPAITRLGSNWNQSFFFLGSKMRFWFLALWPRRLSKSQKVLSTNEVALPKLYKMASLRMAKLWAGAEKIAILYYENDEKKVFFVKKT